MIKPIINNQISAEIVIKIVNCLSSFIMYNLESDEYGYNIHKKAFQNQFYNLIFYLRQNNF